MRGAVVCGNGLRNKSAVGSKLAYRAICRGRARLGSRRDRLGPPQEVTHARTRSSKPCSPSWPSCTSAEELREMKVEMQAMVEEKLDRTGAVEC
jgi:hypothetical protein